MGENGGNGGVSATSSFTIDNVANNIYSISIGNGGAGGTAADGTQGGTSSIIGNSLNISCAGGLGGRGGLTSQALIQQAHQMVETELIYLYLTTQDMAEPEEEEFDLERPEQVEILEVLMVQ
jgi:hypothetical protein